MEKAHTAEKARTLFLHKVERHVTNIMEAQIVVFAPGADIEWIILLADDGDSADDHLGFVCESGDECGTA